LSVDISNNLLTSVTWTAYYANTADTFGTLASPTRTQIATGTFTVTSTLTNYNAQISIPAAATTGIEIVFTVGAQTSSIWVIGNVQLEKGSTATSFDYRPYTTELALAQRYYFRAQADDTSYLFGVGSATTTTAAAFVGNYPVPMRITPTALEQNGTAAHYTVQTGGSDRSSSAVVAYNVLTTQQLYCVQTTVASGQTAGQGGFLYGQNLTAYLGWSAEL
jgi:hypothetical protein